ncbi:amino acid adenylation domain-containing protein [Actinomadura litoris]|uniref:amino acid adenylation domain-containing protein n=1 Tax=Actinomadura litoris TaxID=2678616 RepID=UPI001FA813C9|nr:amino acid adenylation domain-containing protein [Actinomadura litoris]
MGSPCTARDEGLHETVARLAAARPGATALVAGRNTMTYAELDRTADAWAARLAMAGVAPGDRVSVLLPRSTELVVALLAVLKAGAAYALLDPAWPERRLREVTAQLGSPVVIARRGTGTGLGRPVWTPPAGAVTPVAGFHPAAVGGSDPCCVFFTSGTTGEPKGVVSPHRATARLFQAGGFARFDPGAVVPLAAPMSWDAFSLELWSMLLNGGASLIVDEPYLSGASLREAVSAHGVRTVWLTGSLFNMIVDEAVEAFDGLHQVMIGGERLSTGHVGRFLRRHPRVTLINGYGPVESTVFATTHRVTEADCERPGGIPIGRPVPGTGVHVLDGSRPCAVGEVGEICVSGDGLALGYLGDADLTDARFARVSIGGEPLRVYRTGDLGVWDAGGLLHYRGRDDRQVKIRGHRVEPAEVERQVERLLPAVRACRVLARRDASGAARDLVAFCVPADPGDPLDGALAVLRDDLVPYQRPGAVVSVAAFPMTERGKLDEPALLALAPAPAMPAAPAAPTPAPAGTARLVAEVFAEVLGREGVPADVPFVELGGDSLGAGRVCARLTARLGRPVPVSWLYRDPTPAALAHRLDTTTPQEADTHTVEDMDAETPLTSMQLVYLTRHLVDPFDRTAHCLLTWLVEGAPDRAALEAAIAEVHRRHEPLRAAYVPDPRPVAWPVDVPPPALTALPAQPTPEAAATALRKELARGLEPMDGDVWRTALVPIGDGASALFGCAVHHIAFDGWSEAVLAHDLSAAYNTAGPLEEAPSMAAVHREHAERLRQDDRAAHLDHLRAELTDVPPLRWPPGATETPPVEPRHIEVPLSPAVVAGVDALAAGAGATRFGALLALYGACLAEVTGQDDLAVGVPVDQRHGRGLEGSVGCHITTLCVRLRGAALGGGPAAVAATGRAAARAFAAQDVPLDDVLRLAEAADGSPLYRTLFALQDNAVPRLTLTGVRTTFLRQPYVSLPLDLHAELWPDEHGGMTLVVSYRPEAVPEAAARELAKRFADRLRTVPAETGGTESGSEAGAAESTR